MRYYRVKLIGQETGRAYLYSVPLPDRVPPVEAKTRAMSIHGNSYLDGEVSEPVHRQGASVKLAPRCWSLDVRRWRIVRCGMDNAHVNDSKWHCSPKGDVWPTSV